VGMIQRAQSVPNPSETGQTLTTEAVAADGFGAVQEEYPLSYTTTWWHWITAGSFNADAGSFIDPLTAIMLMVVTVVGFFIVVYAAGYMSGEDGYFRFFAYMGLFVFSMTCLVLADNFVMLYLGWEG